MHIKTTGDSPTMKEPATYRIVVRGGVPATWSERLAGMNITERYSDGGEVNSILIGRLPDQAAFSSVMNILYELHLPVISADCLDAG